MIDDVVIEPMTEDFLLWRCLHPHYLRDHWQCRAYVLGEAGILHCRSASAPGPAGARPVHPRDGSAGWVRRDPA